MLESSYLIEAWSLLLSSFSMKIVKVSFRSLMTVLTRWFKSRWRFWFEAYAIIVFLISKGLKFTYLLRYWRFFLIVVICLISVRFYLRYLGRQLSFNTPRWSHTKPLGRRGRRIIILFPCDWILSPKIRVFPWWTFDNSCLRRQWVIIW